MCCQPYRVLFTACVAIFWTFSIAFAQPTGKAPSNSSPPDHARPGWERTPTSLRAPGGERIRAIHHPPRHTPALRAARTPQETPRLRRQARPAHEMPQPQRARAPRPARPETETDESTATAPSFIHVLSIDAPPIDGFVPYIAVVATDERSGTLELDAIPSTTVGGTNLRPDPLEASYAIGLFDTGAGAHVMGNAAGIELGLFAHNLLTNNLVTITGVTGAVDARVSQPIGLYIDSMESIDAQSLLLDTTDMVGQTNVAIAVGQTPAPGNPDLPTAIGSPLAVYYAAAFDNDQPVSRTIDSETYESPLKQFYVTDDPQIPEYPYVIPLELRPLGGVSVQYVPDFDTFAPQTPSVIIGNSAQSLFFVGSVDCYDGTYSAIDKDRFMLDTGAQVTVVGSRVAARLNLNPDTPDFFVEIVGVTGDATTVPGFTLDRIDMPALGEWLSYTDVPVVLLDVASPEGGTLDGIIGMNLFLEFNFVLRGGGLFLQPDPTLEFEPVISPAINADFDGDGDVDLVDFAMFQRCMTGESIPQTDPGCAYALLNGDEYVDQADLDLFRACFSGPGVPADPMCVE